MRNWKSILRRRLAAGAALASLLTLLGGCVSQVETVRVEPDGSGTVSAWVGLPEACVRDLEKELDLGEEARDGLAQVGWHGEEYWAVVLGTAFASAESLDLDLWRYLPEDSGPVVRLLAERLNFGQAAMENTGDGVLTLTVTPPAAAGDVELEEADAAKRLELTTAQAETAAEILAQYAPQAVQLLTFELPAEPIQTAGQEAGVTVEGTTLTLDYAKMVRDGSPCAFVIGAKPGETPEPEEGFSDVLPGTWYYDAVMLMKRSGLVAGMGDGTFHPEDEITVAQFATILARFTGLPAGSGHTQFWGELGVRSCREMGYIQDRDTDWADAYNAPITRQEAIAGMQMASRTKPEGTWTLADIPDGGDIDPTYQGLIVDAYNAGLTVGMDEAHTFAPKSHLTRAEICQLLAAVALPDHVTMNSTYQVLNIGASVDLEMVNLPAGLEDQAVEWTSSNTEVLTVDGQGHTVAVGPGSAFIIAECGESSAMCLFDIYTLTESQPGAPVFP